MAVPLAGSLSRLAWIGTGLLAAQATVLAIARPLHKPVTGAWLILAALAAAGALAVYSRGFRRGPAWAHRAAFGAGLAGLALSALIIILNV